MNTAFHLDDATIMAYAGGSLADCLSVVAAGHIAVCDHCRSRVRRAEKLGAALLNDAHIEHMSPSALDDVFARIDGGDWVQPEIKAEKCVDATIPAPVDRVLGQKLDDIKWRKVGAGVGMHMIKKDDGGSSLYMLKVKPGHKLPDHGHEGQEMTLILRGAYRDHMGRYAVGDVADLDEGIEHQPIIEEGEDCICLIASEAPARFKGIVPRLLQPIVGI